MIKIQYTLLSIITLSTIYSIYAGDSYTIKGILGIIFFISCILKRKLEKRNIAIDIAFWGSSIIGVSFFVLEKFF